MQIKRMEDMVKDNEILVLKNRLNFPGPFSGVQRKVRLPGLANAIPQSSSSTRHWSGGNPDFSDDLLHNFVTEPCRPGI
jgi:hypothetical protein